MAGYRLKSDSPALGRAQPITGLLTDKAGRPRANPPDLGTWEFADKPAGAAHAPAVSALELLAPVTPPDFIPGLNSVRNPSTAPFGPAGAARSRMNRIPISRALHILQNVVLGKLKSTPGKSAMPLNRKACATAEQIIDS